MRKISFLVVLFVISFFGCKERQPQPQQYPYSYDWEYNNSQQPPKNNSDVYYLRGEFLQVHNARRKSVLKVDSRLEAAAQRHANWMARNRNLSHTEGGSNVHDRVGSSGFKTIGENIAYGYRSTDDTMNAWMRSCGHRRNIENESFSHVGFGIAYSTDGTPYYCVVFGGG
jgi:uncharacterized protein YkwD